MVPETLKHKITAIMQPGASEGWLTPERGIEMADLIIQVRPKVVVEIGVFGARSLVAQALALKENGFGKIYGIDPWKLEMAIEGENEANREWWTKNVNLHNIHNGAMGLIWAHGLDEHAIVIRAPSHFASMLFSGDDVMAVRQEIDIANIDGCHSEIASCRDVELYLPCVRRGGYIWMDDCDWPSTKRAQQLLERECATMKTSPDGHYKLYKKG